MFSFFFFVSFIWLCYLEVPCGVIFEQLSLYCCLAVLHCFNLAVCCLVFPHTTPDASGCEMHVTVTLAGWMIEYWTCFVLMLSIIFIMILWIVITFTNEFNLLMKNKMVNELSTSPVIRLVSKVEKVPIMNNYHALSLCKIIGFIL